MVELAAKAINLKVARRAPPDAVWISEVVGETLFRPLTHSSQAFMILEKLHLDLQWAHERKHLVVRCRVPSRQWNTRWFRKWQLKECIVTCAALHQKGEG